MFSRANLSNSVYLSIVICLIFGLLAAVPVGCVRTDLAAAFGHEAPLESPGQQTESAPEPAPTPTPVGQPTSKTSQPPVALVVTGLRLVVEQGVKYVVGTVKNNTRQNYRYVQLEMNLYDKSGSYLNTLLKNSAASNQAIPPGSSWAFKAIVMDNRASSVRTKSVKGFQ